MSKFDPVSKAVFVRTINFKDWSAAKFGIDFNPCIEENSIHVNEFKLKDLRISKNFKKVYDFDFWLPFLYVTLVIL